MGSLYFLTFSPVWLRQWGGAGKGAPGGAPHTPEPPAFTLGMRGGGGKGTGALLTLLSLFCLVFSESSGVPVPWFELPRSGPAGSSARAAPRPYQQRPAGRGPQSPEGTLTDVATSPFPSPRPDLAQLRKKFEEDKQRIELMRAQRKFRPY